MEINTMTIHQIAELLEKKEAGSVEITKSYLERIDQVDGKIGAFLTVARDEALAQAQTADARRAQGEKLTALAGIPFAVKDNICTAGLKTTCASKMLSDYLPPYDATVVGKLKTAGAIVLGKGNMDEFAMGSSTENSAFFPTRNPFNPGFVPGGSSGGPAAAVAAGEAAFALGSDTGGGIRQPAAFCGVIGLKPTYGLVSRSGLVSYASSLDHIGPLVRDMTDLALVLQAISGYDAGDSSSVNAQVPDYLQSMMGGVRGLRIGLPREYWGEKTEAQVSGRLWEAVRQLEDLGACCEEISLPHAGYAAAAYYLIASAEASSNLARYDGVRYGLRVEASDVQSMFQKTRSAGFGAEVKRRIVLGTFALSAAHYEGYYLKALKVRTLVRQDLEKAFEKYDCLLTPTAPTVAFQGGQMAAAPWAGYAADFYTVPASLAGVPALSLPFGLAGGLPVGLQLIAGHWAEEVLLRVGYALEQNTEQTRLRPNLAANICEEGSR